MKDNLVNRVGDKPFFCFLAKIIIDRSIGSCWKKHQNRSSIETTIPYHDFNFIWQSQM